MLGFLPLCVQPLATGSSGAANVADLQATLLLGLDSRTDALTGQDRRTETMLARDERTLSLTGGRRTR